MKAADLQVERLKKLAVPSCRKQYARQTYEAKLGNSDPSTGGRTSARLPYQPADQLRAAEPGTLRAHRILQEKQHLLITSLHTKDSQ